MLLASVLLILLSACNKPLPALEGFDKAAFEGDKNGCQGIRSTYELILSKQQEKLLSLRETQIVELLGMPDENELYKRNQKFYFYYLKPNSRACGGADSSAVRLMVRFNAMGLAKEVTIE